MHVRDLGTHTILASVAFAAALVLTLVAEPDAATSTPRPTLERPSVVETTFKSVDATVAGQWDFPSQTHAPLVVLIPAAGAINRNGLPPGGSEDRGRGVYALLTEELVEHGFAVFRFDKPGTGKSGRGIYATERSNALEAYRRAVEHARVDTGRVFLLGHSYGTDTIAGIYSRYEEIQPPVGVVLVSNRASEVEITRVKAPTLIVVGERDPDDLYKYGKFAFEARESSADAKFETSLVSVPEADHALLVASDTTVGKQYAFDPRVTQAILDWLMNHRSGPVKAGR